MRAHSFRSEAARKSAADASACSPAIRTSKRTRNLWSAARAGSIVSSLAAPAAFAPGSSCEGSGVFSAVPIRCRSEGAGVSPA
jgi:hypothetical protein